MKKLKLAVEELAIQSFDTAAAGDSQRGTVLGRDDTDPNPPAGWTEDPYGSRCCYTWALDARCADSMRTSPGECPCWPVE